MDIHRNPDVLWAPSEQRRDATLLHEFTEWVGGRHGRQFDDYEALWSWSVDDLDGFWSSVWEFFEVRGTRPSPVVLADKSMPGARWFPDATINYAENALRHDPGTPALISVSEGRAPTEKSWNELRGQVGAFAEWLTDHGVGLGDRVVGYLPAVAESVVAFLGCASIGAVWASCSQEFSAQGAADRFKQLEPKILVCADGYRYAGKVRGRAAEAEELRGMLPSLVATVWVENLPHADLIPTDATGFSQVVAEPKAPVYTPVPFDHPLWVLFSSATTGPPKGIVHGHGGVVLEHMKYLGLHLDLRAGQRFFWFTTTSWMMWNVQVSGLLHGATIVLYDGSPNWPDERTLWRIADVLRLDYFGTSASFLIASQKLDIDLATEFDLTSMRGLGSTGSPLPPGCATWICRSLPSVWLGAGSGGTDIVSGFCGSVPTLAVRAAEMQGRILGVSMYAWDDDGNELVGEVGELVVTRPLPSMPIYFWNDPDGDRYRTAYFDTYPGIWRHGDWVTVSESGGVIVHGRSDATLNRFGVRMGSAEIYEALDGLGPVVDSLIVGVEEPDGEYWMPIFIVASDQGDTASFSDLIKRTIRTNVSPRHVPDDVFLVGALPRTLTGKRLEVPIKRILQGVPVDKAANAQSIVHPETLTWFAELARKRSAIRDHHSANGRADQGPSISSATDKPRH